ncbi:uncharacterized protein LOC144199319 [Stigmatopora nigra]
MTLTFWTSVEPPLVDLLPTLPGKMDWPSVIIKGNQRHFCPNVKSSLVRTPTQTNTPLPYPNERVSILTRERTHEHSSSSKHWFVTLWQSHGEEIIVTGGPLYFFLGLALWPRPLRLASPNVSEAESAPPSSLSVTLDQRHPAETDSQRLVWNVGINVRVNLDGG